MRKGLAVQVSDEAKRVETIGEGTRRGAGARDSAGEKIPPEKCAVLVLVGSHIERRCEEGLVELERRGYKVWRVGGYANIDLGRAQGATDALAGRGPGGVQEKGCEETLWIDSDVAFLPDDVEKLRAHNLPLVCGIYPKKGPRELTAFILPETRAIVFGREGGLLEIKYANGGFLLVRREVFEAMQRQLKLPVCNLGFGRPVVPYFMPLLIETEAGPWYSTEDYSFCERARQCGYKILADTSLRLGHIGSYEYGWEDAGGALPRYSTYKFLLAGPAAQQCSDSAKVRSAPTNLPALAGSRLAKLWEEHPWPGVKPAVRERPDEGWLHDGVKRMLIKNLSAQTQLVFEVGSWLGLSTRFIAEQASAARIIAIDHWRGNPEHQADAETADLLPLLHETFLANCWNYRERLLPLRMDSCAGLALLAQLGLRPDLVYLDAAHEFDAVIRDLRTILDLFPTAIIVGDDWDWPGVRRAVGEVTRTRGLRIEIDGVAWRYTP